MKNEEDRVHTLAWAAALGHARHPVFLCLFVSECASVCARGDRDYAAVFAATAAVNKHTVL
jgi:hypothetical protein